jgi:transposase
VKRLLTVKTDEVEDGYRVSARQDLVAIEDAKTRFGKHILFTDRETISARDVIQFYRDRNTVEDTFRISKSDKWGKMDPAFHWTDNKIRVHALTCVIALLLIRTAHKRARQNGFAGGVERMMELLTGIRSAVLLYPGSNKPIRKLCYISKEQSDLLTTFGAKLKTRM